MLAAISGHFVNNHATLKSGRGEDKWKLKEKIQIVVERVTYGGFLFAAFSSRSLVDQWIYHFP